MTGPAMIVIAFFLINIQSQYYDCCTTPSNPNLGDKCKVTVCLGIGSCNSQDVDCDPEEEFENMACKNSGAYSYKVDCNAGIYYYYSQTGCGGSIGESCSTCKYCYSALSMGYYPYVKFAKVEGSGASSIHWCTFVYVIILFLVYFF